MGGGGLAKTLCNFYRGWKALFNSLALFTVYVRGGGWLKMSYKRSSWLKTLEYRRIWGGGGLKSLKKPSYDIWTFSYTLNYVWIVYAQMLWWEQELLNRLTMAFFSTFLHYISNPKAGTIDNRGVIFYFSFIEYRFVSTFIDI